MDIWGLYMVISTQKFQSGSRCEATARCREPLEWPAPVWRRRHMLKAENSRIAWRSGRRYVPGFSQLVRRTPRGSIRLPVINAVILLTCLRERAPDRLGVMTTAPSPSSSTSSTVVVAGTSRTRQRRVSTRRNFLCVVQSPLNCGKSKHLAASQSPYRRRHRIPLANLPVRDLAK